MIRASSTLSSVAYEVCTALDSAGYTAVMTGGSAATFYAPRAYLSDDLDFVLTLRGTRGEDVLRGLGFTRRADFYVHAQSRFSLDFPPGPLAVGNDVIESWRTFRKGKRLLHVLTPTDSVRDRLASFLFWNDFRGLEQALAVHRAQTRRVKLAVVEDWCRRERQADKFRLFLARARRRT